MTTIKQLEHMAKRARATIARTDKILNVQSDIPGPWVTGPSNYPKSLSKRLDQDNERRAQAFRESQKAKADLKFAEARLEGVRTGERHPNGQRRADAPSRQREQTAKDAYTDFAREYLKVGDTVALVANQQSKIAIKRVNTKTITDEHGEKWEFIEVLPLVNGIPMSEKEFMMTYKAWKTARQATPMDPDNDYLWQEDRNVYPFDTVVYEPLFIPYPALNKIAKFTIGPAAYGSKQMVVRKLFDNNEWQGIRFFSGGSPYENYEAAREWIRRNFPAAVIYGEPYPPEE